ncbi:MAG: YlxR family protein [Eubacterium sp.]|nr:YlxR family protein [Eubacterium sp.]
MGSGRIPERTCIGCRCKKDKKELLRIVCIADGEVILDERQSLPGRGAYICDDEMCLQKVINKRALNRTFRREIKQEQYKKLEQKFGERNTAG